MRETLTGGWSEDGGCPSLPAGPPVSRLGGPDPIW